MWLAYNIYSGGIEIILFRYMLEYKAFGIAVCLITMECEMEKQKSCK